jgi:hypothetical protein
VTDELLVKKRISRDYVAGLGARRDSQEACAERGADKGLASDRNAAGCRSGVENSCRNPLGMSTAPFESGQLIILQLAMILQLGANHQMKL